jgi:hypothetical protein
LKLIAMVMMMIMLPNFNKNSLKRFYLWMIVKPWLSVILMFAPFSSKILPAFVFPVQHAMCNGESPLT